MSLVAWAVKQAQFAEAARRERPRRPQARTSWYAEAEARYREGATIREIAAEVGKHHSTVADALRARGVMMRKRGNRQPHSEQARAANGRGGRTTLERYGREHFAAIGRKGGTKWPKR